MTGYSIVPKSQSSELGLLDLFHRFEGSDVAVCGEKYAGRRLYPRDQVLRPGLPLHCNVCESLFINHQPIAPQQ